MSTTRRLGLLGGSFDPVHGGHLFVARAAREAFALDRVALVPAARPPHKPGVRLAPGADRLAMLRLAIADEPWLVATGIELRRAGPSFTIDTVRALPSELGEPPDSALFLVIGSDNLPGLPGWREADELLRRVQPIVVWRGDEDPRGVPPEVARALGPELAAKLERGFLAVPRPHPARASDLRAALARGALDKTELHPAVRDYIRARGLYRPA